MTCFHPLQAYSSDLVNPTTGKKVVVFRDIPHNWLFGSYGPIKDLKLPCGRCIGCRLERSRQWAVRCMHESSLYDDNCYLTLTYSDEKLPSSGSLQVRDFQLFMKRLRRRFPRDRDNGIRFFHCGEYSPTEFRPHYHACVFNFDFPDRKFLKKSKCGEHDIDTSQICDEVWGHGHCFIGDVSFNSAAYVARYIIDKLNGDPAVQRYCNKDTGEILKPEYVTMSRNPGIGSKWLSEFKSDVYPSDEVIVHGLQMRPPKFYDSKLEADRPDLYAEMKAKRELEAVKYSDDQTLKRLRIREVVRLAKLNLFKRS